ncbi:MAG: hypothetical protein V4733_12595 [Verrucomicrobiota bacterium]
MRGSPLLNSVALLVFLITAAFGFVRLTSARITKPVDGSRKIIPAARSEATVEVPYRLILSAKSRAIFIDSGNGKPVSSESGVLSMDARNPAVSLRVNWQTPPASGEQRFAKLILEWPGKPTLTRVFDAPGDIDDFLELPAAK